MKKHRRGFTLIEVVLFLGLTSALFLGIAIGVQNSVFQQRYNDSVQSFAEFLRSVYSQVANVQNEKYGRTGKAIYGKVVTFDVLNEGTDDERNLIKTYNLIGDIRQAPVEEAVSLDEACRATDMVIDRLCALDASVVFQDDDFLASGEAGMSNFHTVGFVETYEPRWDARIQTTTPYQDGSGYDLFRGIIVITHSPSSGNISTYVMQDPHGEVANKNELIKTILGEISSCESEGSTCQKIDKFNPFTKVINGTVSEHYLTSEHFKSEPIDFCVNPNGLEKSSIRRDIRLDTGAHNASSVEVIVEDRVDGTADDVQQGDLNRCAI